MIKKFFDFSRQCKYLKLEKPSGIEIEMPIHKRSTINWLEGWAKRTPPGLIGLKIEIDTPGPEMNQVWQHKEHEQTLLAKV